MNDANEFELGFAHFVRDLDHLSVIGVEDLELASVTLAQIVQNRLIFQTRRSIHVGAEALQTKQKS